MTSLRATLPSVAGVESAVLAPVYRGAGGEVRLVLIVRGPRGIHGNQVALPGGRREAEDATLAATALREAEEEIGLRPERVELLQALPHVLTMTGGVWVAPFLGRLVGGAPPAWRIQEAEVAAVLDVAVADLLRPGVHDEEEWQLPSWPAPRLVPFYRIGTHKLWGATYRILHPILPRLQAGEWPI